jgi:hypothetical protein
MTNKHAPKRGIKPGIAAAILLAALAAGLALALILLFPRKPVIAFYRLPEPVVSAIMQEASLPENSGKQGFSFITLDGELPLPEQKKALARADLLFTEDGRAAAELAPRAIPAGDDLLRLMPTAMRFSGRTGETAWGLPLLLDHFELAWNMSMLSASGYTKPETISKLRTEAAGIRKPGVWPIVCAGADDGNLLMLTGALTEALSGADACLAVADSASRGTSFRDLLATTKLGETLDTLISWRKEGLLHPEWFRMTESDVAAFMDDGFACFVLMPLSAHRRVPQKVIERFDSTMFPSDRPANSRSFVAPAVVALRMDRKGADSRAAAFYRKLVEPGTQMSLANRTGLAPVSSTAETRDRQAYDVRLWVASSARPLPDLGTAAFAAPADRAALALNIRNYIESGGQTW